MVTRSSVAWLLSALLLGGCGGSSSGDGNAEKKITVPAYSGFPAIPPRHHGNAGTVPARGASLLRCSSVVPCPVSFGLRRLFGARAPPVPRVQGPSLRRCDPAQGALTPHNDETATGHRLARRIQLPGRDRSRTHSSIGRLAGLLRPLRRAWGGPPPRGRRAVRRRSARATIPSSRATYGSRGASSRRAGGTEAEIQSPLMVV